MLSGPFRPRMNSNCSCYKTWRKKFTYKIVHSTSTSGTNKITFRKFLVCEFGFKSWRILQQYFLMWVEYDLENVMGNHFFVFLRSITQLLIFWSGYFNLYDYKCAIPGNSQTETFDVAIITEFFTFFGNFVVSIIGLLVKSLFFRLFMFWRPPSVFQKRMFFIFDE